MRTTNLLCSVILACTFVAGSAYAKARPSSGKAKTASAKSAKGSKTGSRTSSRAGSKAKRARPQAVRAAPRQSEPTPERYMEIQQALVDKGFHSGPATGVWGPEWVAALKDFQSAQNMSVDGKLGALSIIALGLGPHRDSAAQFAGKPEPGQ